MTEATLPPLSEQAKALKPGIYEHYKGLRKELLAVALHSETLEEMVVYKSLYGEGTVWVRPVAMFCEEVEIEGRLIPRFRFVGTTY